MKKSQRLRFYALVTKQSEGKALAEAEAAELKTLAALVALHPSAAEDTADETDEEKKKRLEKEKEEETAKKKAEDEKNGDDEKKKKDEDAKGSKPTAASRLSSALAALKGGTPAEAAAALKTEKTAHAKTSADLTQARADLATVNASLSSTSAALYAICDFLGIKPAEVAGKTQADIDGIINAKISAASIEQVASLGFTAPLPSPTTEPAADSSASLIEQYNALPADQKPAFYAKHKAKLFPADL